MDRMDKKRLAGVSVFIVVVTLGLLLIGELMRLGGMSASEQVSFMALFVIVATPILRIAVCIVLYLKNGAIRYALYAIMSLLVFLTIVI